jgi:hypothetical protein
LNLEGGCHSSAFLMLLGDSFSRSRRTDANLFQFPEWGTPIDLSKQEQIRGDSYKTKARSQKQIHFWLEIL